jgi:hypothetical protein
MMRLDTQQHPALATLEVLSLAGFSEDLISVTSQEIKRNTTERGGKGPASEAKSP